MRARAEFGGFRGSYRNTAAMAEFLEKELGLAADSPGAYVSA